MQHKAKKRFGQNFLHDKRIIGRIVSSINPKEGENIVEIGPGLGAMTLPVLECCKKMTAIELDRSLIENLQKITASIGELILHQGDALKFDLGELSSEHLSPENQKMRLIGNLPYNISTPLLFHFVKWTDRIQDMHFMLQKEVVQRMAACPGTKIYGRLSVMLQYHCHVESLFEIHPGAFNPPPKVDSAIVRLIPHAAPPVQVDDMQLFSEMVTAAFNGRRKTIRNSLKKFLSEDQIQQAGLDPQIRPEQLELAQFAALANAAYILK
ncbi:MAG: 16S rRNA (adenine(1518)-N(6)/adenine(1519)-N(6))-dimethyltransferase RsmA [Gammaproteobacteria bacterium]|nr:MAG: 16S rRNA (adenine(1518)-N(6)/adenine(1519)-N(6))-dimethyltransferase RsmA [Gammaproteobacteria bacterium]